MIQPLNFASCPGCPLRVCGHFCGHSYAPAESFIGTTVSAERSRSGSRAAQARNDFTALKVLRTRCLGGPVSLRYSKCSRGETRRPVCRNISHISVLPVRGVAQTR
jgi:hypothetical protein